MNTKTNNSIDTVKIKVQTVTQTMQENVQFALSNTDRIENIQQKSELLQESSNTFRSTGSKLHHTMCARYWKYIVVGCMFTSILAFIIFMILRWT